MKKLFPEAPDVPQAVANRAVRVVEKHLRQHKVDRAKDLPEEAKIRLLRDLRALFQSELAESGPGHPGSLEQKNWFAKLMERVENFLNFGEAAIILALPLILRGGFSV